MNTEIKVGYKNRFQRILIDLIRQWIKIRPELSRPDTTTVVSCKGNFLNRFNISYSMLIKGTLGHHHHHQLLVLTINHKQ